jgi:hypothetical protein
MPNMLTHEKKLSLSLKTTFSKKSNPVKPIKPFSK